MRIQLILRARTNLRIKTLHQALQQKTVSLEATQNALDSSLKELHLIRSALESYRRVHRNIVGAQHQQEELFQKSVQKILRNIHTAEKEGTEILDLLHNLNF